MLLYDKQECPFCWKVRLALSHKGILYQNEHIDTEDKPEHFLQVSPTGKVPVLLTDTDRLYESTLILHYLEDAHPNPSLLPETVHQRHRARFLNYYADTVIGPRIREAIFTQRNSNSTDADEEIVEAGRSNWRACLEELEQHLEGDFFFCGELFSFAECALLPRFALAAAYHLDGIKDFPRLQTWFEHHRRSALFLKTAPPRCLTE